MVESQAHADLPLILDAERLEAERDRPDLQIVAVDDAAEYEAVHIPGAVQIDYADIIHNEGAVKGLLPPPSEVADKLGGLGLRPDSHVVAYDRTGGAQASRFLFTLDVVGHERFSLLDGGLNAWLKADLPTETGTVTPARSDYAPRMSADRLADRTYILNRLNDPDLKLLDTRSQPEFSGAEVRGARGGHIPGAAHMNWIELKDRDDRMLDREDILAKLAERNITPEDEVVVYCHSHTRSSHSYIALKAAGFKRIRGYPGAWSDWSSDPDTPVHTL